LGKTAISNLLLNGRWISAFRFVRFQGSTRKVGGGKKGIPQAKFESCDW